jgi:hypothetical protein
MSHYHSADLAVIKVRRLVRLALDTCPDHGIGPTHGYAPGVWRCTRRACAQTWTTTDVRYARQALRRIRQALRRLEGA